MITMCGVNQAGTTLIMLLDTLVRAFSKWVAYWHSHAQQYQGLNREWCARKQTSSGDLVEKNVHIGQRKMQIIVEARRQAETRQIINKFNISVQNVLSQCTTYWRMASMLGMGNARGCYSYAWNSHNNPIVWFIYHFNYCVKTVIPFTHSSSAT